MAHVAWIKWTRHRVRRLSFGLVAAVAAVLAVPAVASAAITVKGVTLNGAASLSAPPGSVAFSSEMTVSLTAGTTWRSIQYSYNSDMSGSTCRQLSANVTGSGGSKTIPSGVVFPRTPDTYNAYFVATSGTSCGGTKSAVFTLRNAVRVSKPGDNPNLAAGCGLDVMLVLDESSSIASSGATQAVRNAATSFVQSLSGTGSHVAITVFSSTARLGVGYTLVNQSTVADVFTPYINTKYSPNGTTNWQAAFETVKQANAAAAENLAGARHADLVVFITDGDPNTVTNANGSTTYRSGQDGGIESMVPAVAAADTVKGQRSHVFVVGVGSSVSNAESEARLTAISGPTAFPSDTHAFGETDYTIVNKFAELEQALREISVSLCESSLIVTKLVDSADGNGYVVAPGWSFTTTVSASGGHEWIEPPGTPADAPSRTGTTGSGGVARFEWRTNSADAEASVAVAEHQQAGFEFVKAECQTVSPSGTSPLESSTTGIPSATLKPREFRACDVYNQQAVAHLTVTKALVPASDVGRFDLLVDGEPRIEQVGDGGSTGPLTLPLGTYTVSERVSAAESPTVTLSQYTTSTSCVNQNGAVVASGTGSAPVPVTLASSADNVVCTITNTRVVEPEPPITPPGPDIVPPPPCGDFASADPECDAGLIPAIPLATLSIDKRMPAHAAPGSRVRVTITVTNHGPDAAQVVVVRDTPPGGGRLVVTPGHEVTARRDGSVQWQLGTIAAGQSRTIHVTMVVGATHPGGSVRNTAVAGARNAVTVVANASLRAVSASRPTPPAVTG